MSPSSTACPDCGSTNWRSLGRLPDVAFFAGRSLSAPLPGGELLHCHQCDLRFRHPRLEPAGYVDLYNNERIDTWASTPLRADQRLVLSAIESRLGGSRAAEPTLLDFGCYTGDFLAALPRRLNKWGVEVNAAAARAASERTGATVVGHLDHLPAALRFDFIVTMDVIEHVPSPRLLLAQLLARLTPTGVLVITTGDGNSWLWRMLGARFWYCYYPEHIAFVSQRWMEHHAPSLGADLRGAQTFNYYEGAPLGQTMKRWKQMLRWLLFPSLHVRRQRRRFERHGSDLGLPGIGLTRDHLMLVLGLAAKPPD